MTGAAAAAAFIVSACLYSVMSLPHGPDVFFYVAGLAVVATGARDGPTPDAPAHPEPEALDSLELQLLVVGDLTERPVPAG
jgi:hypothetical protein